MISVPTSTLKTIAVLVLDITGIYYCPTFDMDSRLNELFGSK